MDLQVELILLGSGYDIVVIGRKAARTARDPSYLDVAMHLGLAKERAFA